MATAFDRNRLFWLKALATCLAIVSYGSLLLPSLNRSRLNCAGAGMYGCLSPSLPLSDDLEMWAIASPFFLLFMSHRVRRADRLRLPASGEAGNIESLVAIGLCLAFAAFDGASAAGTFANDTRGVWLWIGEAIACAILSLFARSD